MNVLGRGNGWVFGNPNPTCLVLLPTVAHTSDIPAGSRHLHHGVPTPDFPSPHTAPLWGNRPLPAQRVSTSSVEPAASPPAPSQDPSGAPNLSHSPHLAVTNPPVLGDRDPLPSSCQGTGGRPLNPLAGQRMRADACLVLNSVGPCCLSCRTEGREIRQVPRRLAHALSRPSGCLVSRGAALGRRLWVTYR